MADDEIRRLQRMAERCGPKAFLLALLDPDAPDGGLLRRAGVNARAIVRAYLDYLDGQERWTITQVVGERRRLHVTVEALDEATSRSRSHHFKRWARADTYEKQRDNDLYGRLLVALVKVGADPVLHETWVGKVLLVRDGVARFEFPAATFAEHKAGWLFGDLALPRDPEPLVAQPAPALPEADPTWPPGAASEFAARPA